MVTLSDSPRLTVSIALAGAVVAGVLAMLVCLALPVALIEAAMARTGLPALIHAAAPPLGRTARAVLALASGGGAALFGWTALRMRLGSRGVRVRLPVLVRRASRSLSVRRADAHPDAPPRMPIRADREFAQVSIGSVERTLPADLATPLSAYDAEAIPPVPLSPARAPRPLARPAPPPRPAPPTRPAPLAPGERIETFALEHHVPPDHAHSIESLLARLERGARVRAMARSG